MGRKTIDDDEMMIDYSNNISYTNSKIEWTQWTHWTYPSYCPKFAKLSMNLPIFKQFLEGGMSSVCKKVTGHPPLLNVPQLYTIIQFLAFLG